MSAGFSEKSPKPSSSLTTNLRWQLTLPTASLCVLIGLLRCRVIGIGLHGFYDFNGPVTFSPARVSARFLSSNMRALPGSRPWSYPMPLISMYSGPRNMHRAIRGLKEIVIDGECGLLVPPGDADELARALRTLLADESLRARLSANARLRAQHFALQRRSRELLSLVLERKAKVA